MKQPPLDRDIVERLKASFVEFGQIYPVIKAKEDGETLVGRHREEAAKELGVRLRQESIPIEPIAERLGVSVEVAKMVFQAAGNVQRELSSEEKRAFVLEMASLIAASAPRESVAPRVVELLAGYVPRSDIYTYLPEEYKERKRVETIREGMARQKNPEMSSVGMSSAGHSPKIEKLRKEIDETMEYLERVASGEGYTGKSARMSELTRKEGTPSENDLQNLVSSIRVNGKKLNVDYGHRVPIPGQEHEDAARLPDAMIDRWLVLDVEGEGSSSKDNVQRDEQLRKEGKRVIHLTNDRMKDPWYRDLLVQFIVLCVELRGAN